MDGRHAKHDWMGACLLAIWGAMIVSAVLYFIR